MSRAAFARIRLDALQHNLDTLRAASPGTKLMAVVKANAYGHGLADSIPGLAAADAFAVVTLEDAAAIRAAGATQPVVLLEGVFTAGELVDAAAYGCEPVVHESWQLAALDGTDAGPFTVWLKIDTGMNRLGFRPGDAAVAYARLASCRAVSEVRLMTHLSCADERGSGMTARQLAHFADSTAGWPGQRSIANSAALLSEPGSHADWVRPGLSLYGVSPFAGSCGREFGLRPAMTLHASLVSVRDVDAGEAVGYGAAWTAPSRTRVGVAGIGYGDGYPRHVPSGTPVLVNGRRVPLAGRVSMDMLAVDLGAGAVDRPGDPVVLWGEGLPVEEIAQAAGTIPWTLLCGLTERIELRYQGQIS